MAANGQASSSTASPFANVALAIDSYTLDAASGKKKLKTIELDGTLTYEEPKLPRVEYGDQLNRIWNEYPGGLLDLTEDKLREEDGIPSPEEVVEEETDEREKGALLTHEEMEELRYNVCERLNDARNELWYTFELAKTLGASAGIMSDPPPEPVPSAPAPKKGKQAKAGAATTPTTASALATTPMAGMEDPVLPAGTWSATCGEAPTRPDVETAHALELALAAKQQALDDCAALIDAAVDELRLVGAASKQWASDLDALRLGTRSRGQWALVPKPDFDFARGTAPATATSKDIVIPYALDEAPAPVRSRSLAAFDLDPRKAHKLTFSARSYLRLRVLVRTGGTGGPRTASRTYSASEEEGAGVRAIMEAAQLETLDEDLFAELRAEALRIESALIEQQSIALPLGKEKITFMLYDTREAPSPPAPHSPVCDALLAQARLGLLQTYRRRKQRLIDAVPPQGAPGAPPQLATPIFLPLIHLMQYHGAIRTVAPTFETFCATLAGAGLETALVERHSAAANPEAVQAFLTARAKIDVLGVVYTLELPGPSTVMADVTAPSVIWMVTQRSSFVLRDIESLGTIVADAIASQLAPWLYESVRELLPEDDGRVFFDELDGVLVLDSYGPLDISIRAPFTSLTASFAATTVTPYDSTEGGSLVEWLTDLAKNLPPKED